MLAGHLLVNNVLMPKENKNESGINHAGFVLDYYEFSQSRGKSRFRSGSFKQQMQFR